jgi:hypothetical protein
MKYRKKPIIINAFRIGIDNVPSWAMDKVLEGSIIWNHGDYMIQDDNGKFSYCKPDIFDETYEKADIEVTKIVKSTLDAVNRINKYQNIAKPICNY